MKSIDQVLNSADASKSYSASHSAAPSWPVHVELALLSLWEGLIKTKGPSWLKSFGGVDGDAFKSWCKMCSELSKEQLMYGIKEYVKQAEAGNEFINAFIFKQYCKNKHKCLAPAHKPFPKSRRLEDDATKARRKQVALENLEKIKAKLK